MHDVIVKACGFISGDDLVSARRLVSEELQFHHITKNKRKYTPEDMVSVFLNDGFIDRYSGDKLIFPPVLRIISTLLPEEFPFHPNWKMSECHIAYWKILPTVDHVVPVSRGGDDDESNWVSTSQMRNSIKSNWLLEEIGWELHDAGSLEEWDGLTGWFLDYVIKKPELLNRSYYFKRWHKALKVCLADKGI